MRDTLILVSVTVFATSCGVNPDRLATIQARQTQAAEKTASKEKATPEDENVAKPIDPAEAQKDTPPEVGDYTKTSTGCGYYPVTLEARQTAPNQFGDNLITSAYVADATPGNGTRVDCGVIPPVSDAPADVVAVIQEFVAWLDPADIVSMDGNFRYEAGADGQLMRIGTARIYRRNATLTTNKCGGEAGQVTCAAEGSKLARALDLAKHYMGRAEAYRGLGHPDKCKEMAELAGKSVDVTTNEDTSLLYRMAQGQELSHARATEALGQFKRQAETALRGDWCTAQ